MSASKFHLSKHQNYGTIINLKLCGDKYPENGRVFSRPHWRNSYKV